MLNYPVDLAQAEWQHKQDLADRYAAEDAADNADRFAEYPVIGHLPRETNWAPLDDDPAKRWVWTGGGWFWEDPTNYPPTAIIQIRELDGTTRWRVPTVTR